MMENKRPTQTQRVREYMERHGGITALEAVGRLGVLRLASRIAEMKEAGINVASEFVEVENRYGEKCRVKRYWIKGEKA